MSNIKIGITGHQSIPQEAMQFINHRIDVLINKFNGNITCISSLAAGADQIFASSILNAGGKLHAIIPCDGYETTFRNSSDLNAFHNLLRSAEIVEKLNYKTPSEEAFLVAGCRVAKESEILLAVWDGENAKGKGGTADIVEYAKKNKIEVLVIWPLGVKR